MCSVDAAANMQDRRIFGDVKEPFLFGHCSCSELRWLMNEILIDQNKNSLLNEQCAKDKLIEAVLLHI